MQAVGESVIIQGLQDGLQENLITGEDGWIVLLQEISRKE